MTPGQAEGASEDLALADQALRVARLALDEQAREDSASRLYYAVFHAARAALTVRGRHARTHTGLIGLFTETYGETPLLGRLLSWRGEADYQVGHFARTAEEISSAISEASAFVDRCRAIVSDAVADKVDDPDPPADL